MRRDWTPVTFAFNGVAESFDLTASANVVAIDNISAVPEPSTVLMMLLGGVTLIKASRRRRA